jgi:hypothetical protein
MSQEKYVQESFAIIIKGLLYDSFPLNFVVFEKKISQKTEISLNSIFISDFKKQTFYQTL